MNSNSEHLHFVPKNEIPSYEELIYSEKIISPNSLVDILKDAYIYLTETPGLFISFRQLNAILWIGWWIEYLSTLPATNKNIIPSEKIKSNLHKIRKKIELEHSHGKISGLLLMGGGEGTEAHRHAQDWVARFTDISILLFEHQEYVEQKSRGGRFLPLSVGLSMWAHYPNTKLIGLVPRNPGHISQNDFYQSVHDQTGAQFHFASSNDPHRLSKVRRGKYADFCTIPSIETPSTTARTRKLMPNIDLD